MKPDIEGYVDADEYNMACDQRSALRIVEISLREELRMAQVEIETLREQLADHHAEALKREAELRAELRRQSQELERAREIVRRIGEGYNPHRKCLAPTKCCPKNRLCFPCLANDFLSVSLKSNPSPTDDEARDAGHLGPETNTLSRKANEAIDDMEHRDDDY